jgi:hypothetical protein
MPTVGTRRSAADSARGYAKNPMTPFASKFKSVAESILSESGIDIYSEPAKAMMIGSANSALKDFFVEGYAEYYNEAVQKGVMSPEELEDILEDASEMYMNDREAVLENAALNAYNPVIGLTFPIHKNIMMNTVFDKGAIPKVVAREPKFTISLETRLLITPEGEEIDMYKEQYKMTPAIDATAPFTEVELTLPESETTNVLTAIGATDDDSLSIASYISAVYVEGVYFKTGDTLPDGTKATSDGTQDVWYPVDMRFTPGYGDYDRQIMCGFERIVRDPMNDGQTTTIRGTVAGYVKKDKFALADPTGHIKKVKLRARIDTTNAMLATCQVSWKVRTDVIEIPEAIPLNTTVSPEEVKDIGALYQINQLSKILSLFKAALGNYKDDKIKEALDTSFVNLPADSKIAETFDFAPRAGYFADHIEWRHKTFMDALDTHVTVLLQVLNDPNMTISVFGRPDLIRKITPTDYLYQTPTSVAPVELDFVKTVTTSDKRVYQFIGTDKLRDNNNLIIILCPRNTERFVYRIYDYQMYVSNEIRNMKVYTLPAIHAFERWVFKEYQPVQGRLQILNPTGLRERVENTDPIGTSGYNDWTANHPYVPNEP